MPNTFDENPFTTPQKIIKETIELINQTIKRKSPALTNRAFSASLYFKVFTDYSATTSKGISTETSL